MIIKKKFKKCLIAILKAPISEVTEANDEEVNMEKKGESVAQKKDSFGRISLLIKELSVKDQLK